MPDVRRQLRSIRDEAVDFFAHVSAIAASGSSDLLESLTPEDRERREKTREKLGHVVAGISIVFQQTPPLGEGALRTLRRAVRRMDSALRFREWEGWEASTQYWEDQAIGETPAGEYENLVSASTAQSIFENAIDSILGLLSFAPSPGFDVSDQGLANPPGSDITARAALNVERIETWMSCEGYTNKSLATKLRISERTVSSMRNNGNYHGIDAVTKLANLMGLKGPTDLYLPEASA